MGQLGGTSNEFRIPLVCFPLPADDHGANEIFTMCARDLDGLVRIDLIVSFWSIGSRAFAQFII
jgi:hypothetical protein